MEELCVAQKREQEEKRERYKDARSNFLFLFKIALFQDIIQDRTVARTQREIDPQKAEKESKRKW